MKAEIQFTDDVWYQDTEIHAATIRRNGWVTVQYEYEGGKEHFPPNVVRGVIGDQNVEYE